MKISFNQAIDLENKLNLSIYKNELIKLGDILYKWRLNPKLYEIDIMHYYISNQQYKWIKKNIISDLDINKHFYLIVNNDFK